MWTRADLKAKAKDVLRNLYWPAFLVSIVITIASASGSGSGSSSNGTRYNLNPSQRITNLLPSNSTEKLINYEFWGITLVSISILGLLFLAFKLFIGYNLEVGGRKYFIKAAKERNSQMEELGFGFSSGSYFNILKTMLIRSILTFLWFLLLLVPGVIKSYAYGMVPYILADNPSMDAMRAIDLSNQMTKGHKMNIFVLDLSFLGWYILGLLLLGLGIYFVHPYKNATYAELYLVLRQNALDSGLCTHDELLLEQ